MIVQYSPEPLDKEQQDQGVVPWDEFLKIGKVGVSWSVLECTGSLEPEEVALEMCWSQVLVGVCGEGFEI